MSEQLQRFRVLTQAGKPLPPDLVEWISKQMAESEVLLAERNRLLAEHAQRLGGHHLYRGCARLAELLKAQDPSVKDLLDLNCKIPKIRMLYKISKENACCNGVQFRTTRS